MIARQEIRDERNDVVSFWEVQKQLNESKDAIVEVETKIEECTLVELEKRIADYEANILDITAKIEVEKAKIELIKAL